MIVFSNKTTFLRNVGVSQGSTAEGTVYMAKLGSKLAFLGGGEVELQSRKAQQQAGPTAGGDEAAEASAGVRLKPGQTAVVTFYRGLRPQSDLMIGVNPALMGIAQVTHPGWISSARPPEPAVDLAVSITAVKEVDLSKFEWLVSVGAPE
jgi:hypothetical protein